MRNLRRKALIKIKTIQVMKYEKYEKPDLEEMDLILEGSFLNDITGNDPDVPVAPGEGDGDDFDD